MSYELVVLGCAGLCWAVLGCVGLCKAVLNYVGLCSLAGMIGLGTAQNMISRGSLISLYTSYRSSPFVEFEPFGDDLRHRRTLRKYVSSNSNIT